MGEGEGSRIKLVARAGYGIEEAKRVYDCEHTYSITEKASTRACDVLCCAVLRYAVM